MIEQEMVVLKMRDLADGLEAAVKHGFGRDELVREVENSVTQIRELASNVETDGQWW